MNTREISNTDDVIDVRYVIARIDELEDIIENHPAADEIDYLGECRALKSLMDDLKGCGGDEQWCGDWYPLLLIRDSHFREYAYQEALNFGLINAWPYTCIDWDQAARKLQNDYSSVEFDGVTYWYRS